MKKCKICEEPFTPIHNTTQRVCGPPCAIIDGNNTRKKKAEKAHTERKKALKTTADWMKEAQTAFNRYIRARDAGKPCISSGRPISNQNLLTGSRVDAGHYRSRGAAPHLRFNVFNCHAQSVKDNRHLSGNIVEYRMGLIDRIGLDRVERLEQDHSSRKYTAAYLKRVKIIFSKRARFYEKRRNIND